jgi:hypothetical protein
MPREQAHNKPEAACNRLRAVVDNTQPVQEHKRPAVKHILRVSDKPAAPDMFPEDKQAEALRFQQKQH